MPEESIVVFLKAQIGEYSAKMKEAGLEAEHLGKKGAGHFTQLASVGKGALLGLAGGALAVGAISLKMADEWEKSHARLKSSVEASGHSFDDFAKRIEFTDKRAEHYGYTNAQTEGALARLTQATNNPRIALDKMGLAMNVAAARHIDLESAANIVGLAVEGNTRKLKLMLPDLNLTAGSAKDVAKAQDGVAKALENVQSVETRVHDGRLKGVRAAEAITKANEKLQAAQDKLAASQHAGGNAVDALTKRFSGQAAAQAETFGGKIAALKAQGEDLFKTIGVHLIPILEKMVSALLKGVEWLEKHRQVAIALGVVLAGALAIAITAYIAQMAMAAAATIAATWPIIAIVGALAALTVAVLYLWNNWDKVWGWIKRHKALAAVIAALAPFIVAIIAIVVAVHYLYDNWSRIWTSIKHITMGVVEWFQLLPGRFLDALKAIPGQLLGLFSHAWKAVRENLPGYAKQALEWFVALPFIIIGRLVQFQFILNRLFARALLALAHALPGMAAAMFAWFTALPGRILGFIGDVGPTLLGVGVRLLTGLANGYLSVWSGVINFFKSLPGKIPGYIGNVAGLLFDVGKKIMQSLKDGLVAGLVAVKDFLVGVKDKIIGWKGPPSYDETMLVDNGLRVMKGFEAGLARGMNSVRDRLQGFTGELGSPHFSVAGTRGGARVASGGGGGGDVYHFVINTFDGRGAEDAIVKALDRAQRRNGGRLPIKIK